LGGVPDLGAVVDDPMPGQSWVDDEDEDDGDDVEEDGALPEGGPGAVVVEPVVELEPVVDELVVVAASATSAPPRVRPEASAPMVTTVRKRGFMVRDTFRSRVACSSR